MRQQHDTTINSKRMRRISTRTREEDIDEDDRKQRYGRGTNPVIHQLTLRGRVIFSRTTAVRIWWLTSQSTRQTSGMPSWTYVWWCTMEYARMSQYWLDNKMDTIKRRWKTAWYGGILVEDGGVVQQRGRGMKGSGINQQCLEWHSFRISSSNNIISSNN